MVNRSLLGVGLAATISCLNPVKVDGFMQQQVGSGGQRDQVVGGGGVTRNCYRPLDCVEAESKRRGDGWVLDQNSGHRNQLIAVHLERRHTSRRRIVIWVIPDISWDLDVVDGKAIQG